MEFLISQNALVPLFCRNYADHTLLSGFFAAVNAFKQELKQEALTIVGFDGLYDLIESREQLMVLLSTEKKENEVEVHALTKEIRDELWNRYHERLDEDRFNTVYFENFVDWMESN